MAAGIATIEQLKVPGIYDRLEEKSGRLANGLRKIAEKAGVPVHVDRVGSMLGLFFTDRPVRNFEDAKTSDLEKFTAYYQGMLERGIYLAPSQFEACFVSTAHETRDIEKTLEAAREVFAELV
jgi:glutamate-1-semialdehyde 2,1-aminomutase